MNPAFREGEPVCARTEMWWSGDFSPFLSTYTTQAPLVYSQWRTSLSCRKCLPNLYFFFIGYQTDNTWGSVDGSISILFIAIPSFSPTCARDLAWIILHFPVLFFSAFEGEKRISFSPPCSQLPVFRVGSWGGQPLSSLFHYLCPTS